MFDRPLCSPGSDLINYIPCQVTLSILLTSVSCRILEKPCCFVMCKLSDVGVCHQILPWIECFMTECKLHVKVSDSTSTEINVISGVPQGSALGPILFLIYVNHVVFGLKC